jgi:hypothetical protein
VQPPYFQIQLSRPFVLILTLLPGEIRLFDRGG